MAKKCESCRRAFFQSGGYMPCSCKSKEAKPEFVPPPPCIPCTTDGGLIATKQAKFEVVPPYYARAILWFMVGILVGALGCLYATSHIS